VTTLPEFPASRCAGLAADWHSPDAGLSEAKAKSDLARLGYNEILEETAGPMRSILGHLWGQIPWMLEAALVLEVLLGKVAGPALIDQGCSHPSQKLFFQN
jgi:hypothetical protein